MYRPTLRSLDAQTVLAMVTSVFAIKDHEWRQFCAAQATVSGRPAKAFLPGSRQRKAARPAVVDWERKRRGAPAAVARKPSAKARAIILKKRPSGVQVVKRTPFNRKRVMK